MASGTLYIVATPIGNLGDITLRALEVLRKVDLVLCEDTRVTSKLLHHYEIKVPTRSFHQHSSDSKMEMVASLLEEGKNIALVTDAGTPGLSDPGGRLVEAVRESLSQAARIESVPGPSALAAALSISGWNLDRFLFLGFLPHKKGRQTKIKEIVASEYPVILYESKHRILKLLQELEKAGGEKMKVALARELTKKHESFYQGSPLVVRRELEKTPADTKGEFVVMIK